jgi:hypothetical protein
MTELRRGGDRAWLVLARDVSDSVHVDGQPTVAAAIVIDDEEGLIRGTGVAAVRTGALQQALSSAAQAAPKGSQPARIFCPPELTRDVREQIPALGLNSDIAVVEPSAEVEDLFDSLVGHLAGRRQPPDLPSPEDWSMLFRQTQVFAEAQPWLRLSDEVHLRMELQIGAASTHTVGVVLGNVRITYGFALYPADAAPSAGPALDRETRPPPGTLCLTLDHPTALPAHFVAKARRYQWPEALSRCPVYFAVTENGAADLSREHVALLTIALAAALNHDREQVPNESAGQIILSGGRRGRYRVNVAEPAPECAMTDTGALSIDRALDEFLAKCRSRLAARTIRTYESVLELLRACLNNYGYQFLSEAEQRLLQKSYDAGDEQAYCRLFGPEKIAENLGEFLGYFMIRKVLAGEDLLRASGTVTGKLVVWLAARGDVAPDAARAAVQRARTAARDLPKAARLAAVLFDAAQTAPAIDVNRLEDEDYLEDQFVISRVEPGRLWFNEEIGPVNVPKEAADLARPGWTVSVALARVRGRWHIVQAGNVYPG